MITAGQIKLLRTAISCLGLSESDYRNLLAQVGVKTAKDLDSKKLAVVMSSLGKLGWKTTDHRPSGNDSGTGNHATTAQLRMLEGLWMEKAKVKTSEALSAFVKRITKIDKVEWLTTYHIKKVKKAIEAL